MKVQGLGGLDNEAEFATGGSWCYVATSAVLDKHRLIVPHMKKSGRDFYGTSSTYWLVMNDTQYQNYRKRMNASAKLDLNMTHSEASNSGSSITFCSICTLHSLCREACQLDSS